MPTDSYEKIFANKQKVLVVMPHPDDCELYCGATVAKLIKSGKKVRVIKMTYGDKGSKDQDITKKELTRVRKMEDWQAMKVLGIKDEDNIYLGIGDGEVEHDLSTIEKVVYQIRLFKPELIITTNPDDTIIRFDKDINWVNHRDHRHTGRITVDAAYPYARDLLFFPEQLKEKGLGPHVCKEFLFTDVYDHPDLVYIDVTDYINDRSNALAAHVSQYTLDHARESTDFFTMRADYGSRRFDRFRYVIAD
jgi:LmbE family N-acetylglucosaminyl deacetylase